MTLSSYCDAPIDNPDLLSPADTDVFVLPVSFAQQRLWLLDQLEPNSAAYNLFAALHLQGTLNVAVLEETLNEIISRHEILHTYFTTVEDQPMQVIAPPQRFQLPVVDLQSVEASERSQAIQQAAIREIQQPFQLTHPPLWRMTLLKLSATEHILLITIHHILADGWSMGVLAQELAALYPAFLQGQSAPLADLPIQYGDFAIWQQDWLQAAGANGSSPLQTQLDYWTQQLGGELPILQLPSDRPRPAVPTFRGAKQVFSLSPEVSADLKDLSQQTGTTLFMTLLAAFKTLLYRYTGQSDLLVGTPIANRNRAELEGLIGFFANTLVLRTNLSGEIRFRELLQQVRESSLAAYAHQDVPFAKLVEALQPERDLSRNPLFQVMFALQNAPMPALELPDLTLRLLDLDTQTAKFDLTLELFETSEGISGWFEYSTDLFEAETIARLITHFQTLLTGIVADPDQRLSHLPLLSAAERQQLLVDWNQTQADYPSDLCLHQLFEIQVEKTPDAIAAIFEDQKLTYQELNQRADLLAHHLRSLGVGPDVLVGLCVERSLDILVGLLGILKAGGAYVPLDPSYPQERLAFMMEDAQIHLLVTQEKLVDRLAIASNIQTICLDSNCWQTEISDSPATVSPDHLAYVIYTSGSTGKPKGVQITHRSLVNFLWSMQQQPGFTAQDVWLTVTTLSFDIAALELYLPLMVGATVVIASREAAMDGGQLRDRLTSSQAMVMQATPATWRLLLAAGWQAQPGFKALCGGEALSSDLAQQLLDRDIELWNLYGPTETTIWSTVCQVKESDGITIGRPIANTEIYLLDQNWQPVPVGVPGELYIGGDGLARGYLNRPELTAERFIPHPFSDRPAARLYRTGDLARYLPNGTIECIGRIDHQVKVRGHRIELGEIESVLRNHPTVKEAVVIVREDNPGDQRIVAYVVPAPTASATDLRNSLKAQLPGYMVPNAVVFLEALPLTPNGKVDRRQLPAPSVEASSDAIAPAQLTPVEELLVGIWSKILGVDSIRREDNFFELGGHSLLATQVISQIRDGLGIELPLRALFEAPTVAGLAQQIEAARSQKGIQAPPLVPVDRQQQLPLSFAQQRLWVLDQLRPGNAAYNMPGAVRLVGTLDRAALTHSLNEIVRRHEVLRTTFAEVDGQPVQQIAAELTLEILLVDLRSLSASEREAEIQNHITQLSRSAFDLAHGPLLRAQLLQLSEQEHIILLTLHHIVADGWSVGVLIRELAALYDAFSQGQPSPLPELPIQYADFAAWQRQWLAGESSQAPAPLQTQLDYWKRQLSGDLPVLQLPMARPRPAVQSFRGAYQSFQLSAELTRSLQQLSRQSGVTLFMTLLAGFKTLLYRYTQQTDLIVGTDVANRNRSETEALIGFFVNLLVLRTDLSGNPTFGELLKRVREVALGAYAHQDVPFEKLVEALRPDRQANHTPLFQVLFVMQNAPMPPLELSGLTLSPLTVDNQTAKFDLALFMEETPQGLVGTWNYSTDLFEPNAIARLSSQLETLLTHIVADPDARLNSFEILTEAEKSQQVMEKQERKALNLKKFQSIKPKAVTINPTELVKMDYLQPENPFPRVIRPAMDGVDLADWAQRNTDLIETELLQHGAILFRGFPMPGVPDFERFAQSICSELFGEYGDLPREGVSGKVYGSTPYPADKAILFHNESSHLHRWPMKIWFFCVKAAQQGGETPIIDCRKVYQLLDPQLRETFERKQLMYVRNFTEGLDVSWQEFFHTEDKAVVEDYCRRSGVEFEWTENNGLRTRQIRPAVTTHPKTGETVFFNQIQLHHIACLDPAVRQSLLSLFGEERLPRHVYYGDGTPIEDAVVEEVCRIYDQAQVYFPWQEGDVIMLDNMLSAHARNPYVGPRKIVVAMGQMV